MKDEDAQESLRLTMRERIFGHKIIYTYVRK